MINDDRVPIVNDLAEDLHKRLNDLENLYSTVIFYILLFFT